MAKSLNWPTRPVCSVLRSCNCGTRERSANFFPPEGLSLVSSVCEAFVTEFRQGEVCKHLGVVRKVGQSAKHFTDLQKFRNSQSELCLYPVSLLQEEQLNRGLGSLHGALNMCRPPAAGAAKHKPSSTAAATLDNRLSESIERFVQKP